VPNKVDEGTRQQGVKNAKGGEGGKKIDGVKAEGGFFLWTKGLGGR